MQQNNYRRKGHEFGMVVMETQEELEGEEGEGGMIHIKCTHA